MQDDATERGTPNNAPTMVGRARTLRHARQLMLIKSRPGPVI